jgi:hypothetical protein
MSTSPLTKALMLQVITAVSELSRNPRALSGPKHSDLVAVL